MVSPEGNHPLPDQLPPPHGMTRTERNISFFAISYTLNDIALTIGDQIHTAGFREISQTEGTILSFAVAAGITYLTDRRQQRRR